MLPKKNRADRKQIEKIFKEGRFISSPVFTFKFIKTSSIIPRFAFSAPKAASKRANVRNLLRRRGYLSLEKHISDFPSSLQGVFVFSKQGAQTFSKKSRNKKILSELMDQLEKEIELVAAKIH